MADKKRYLQYVMCLCYYLHIILCYKTHEQRWKTSATHFASHYNDVIMTTMACQITSLTIIYSAENIKAPRHWPLCWEFNGDRWIPRTKGQ